MNRSFGRSTSAALRVSLISGCGALGWIFLSAGAATADSAALQSTLDPVSSVVESASTPVEPAAEQVPDPLHTVVEAVASSSIPPPELPSGPAGYVPTPEGGLSVAGTLEPVTELVEPGSLLTGTVNPATTTTIIEPVLEEVVSATAPVLAQVQPVIDPVVETIQPAVEALSPVLEVTAPALNPVADTIEPVVETVAPIAEIAAPATDPATDVVQPIVTLPPSTPDMEPAAPSAADSGIAELEPSPAHERRPGGSQAATTETKTEAVSSAEDTSSALARSIPRPSEDRLVVLGTFALQVNPSSPTTHATTHGIPADAPSVSPAGGTLNVAPYLIAGSSTGYASSSGGSSGASGAADIPSSFNLNLLPSALPQFGYSTALPLGPTFDPGSTPD